MFIHFRFDMSHLRRTLQRTCNSQWCLPLPLNHYRWQRYYIKQWLYIKIKVSVHLCVATVASQCAILHTELIMHMKTILVHQKAQYKCPKGHCYLLSVIYWRRQYGAVTVEDSVSPFTHAGTTGDYYYRHSEAQIAYVCQIWVSQPSFIAR